MVQFPKFLKCEIFMKMTVKFLLGSQLTLMVLLVKWSALILVLIRTYKFLLRIASMYILNG